MKVDVKLPLGFALSVMAASVANARGPLPQPWLVYPAQSMETCLAGTAPPHIAVRCDDLLAAYSSAMQVCVPMNRGGPVVGGRLIALQTTDPDCAAKAALVAARSVK